VVTLAHVLPYFRRQESWEGGARSIAAATPLKHAQGALSDDHIGVPGSKPARRGFRCSDDYNGESQ